MRLIKWDELPDFMKNPEVRRYYEVLEKRKFSFMAKRGFDFLVSLILLGILALPMAMIAFVILIDSKGGIFYRQRRVTSYGKEFMIHKFRTMISNADQIGSLVTVDNDSRITKVGAFLRKYRLDELPQLFDVIRGNMSFVGTRPEVPRYVKSYTPEMYATLLLPAGITSEASIRFRNEAELLEDCEDVDMIYCKVVLPRKMYYNLKSIEKFSFWGEVKTMIRTVFAVLGKDYENKVETERL